ncbi:aldehyde ferredoxin oxidoreductase [Natronococcus amylolyticus DSM 10524]|uniref:Aldehyde ferredoxin oxidoreductase n=1 Tax=Natronococcus amylolyticus DSM 10524 TaxID=1227497 RepID=L9X6X5_9EURY|nr:aldehyde ferredoxin oxidoreductase N-terminal domain-containing protein [Natronococcus amylolyticus]ELY57201.1 aldehyde ferredoxin oxidoreductase [Natronococcus amylolyticus DSM 10524]
MSETLPSVYGGEILHVDLETGDNEIESIDPQDARRFLGGNGFVAKQVAEHVPVDADPFDPENVLALAVGPMNATPFQSTSRGVVGFVSPMTNGFFDSTFGGTLPQALKTTGFDGVVLHGAAEEHSYVVVDEDGAEVKSANGLEGTETYETCGEIRDREGVGYDTHVLANGPAGENLVRYACLVHESEPVSYTHL